jgi:hypothetical protein
MTKLIHRRRRLVLETPFLIGRRPVIVAVEPWGLRLREKGLRARDLPITRAQIWNRASIIAADRRHGERKQRNVRVDHG